MRAVQRPLDTVRFAVVDVETTGVDPAVDRVVEVACVVVRAGGEAQLFSSLVDPGRPIPPRASAIHHLTDPVVRGQPALTDLAPTLAALCADAVVVAHNAAFDLRFLTMLADRPSLCTLRLARRCFPELDGYANQLLRYTLAVMPAGIGHPHRALDDARVTAAVLGVLLRRFRELGHPDRLDALLAFARSELPRRVPAAAARIGA